MFRQPIGVTAIVLAGLVFALGATEATAETMLPPPLGDVCSSAFVIPSVPYSVVGTTTGYSNDYDEQCPYSGSTAPDVVYAYAPWYDEILNISLCWGDTNYDTKMYIYEDACTHGTAIACNDDDCSSPVYANWVSRIECVPLSAGHTYYIVIDGYGTASGTYQLDIVPPPPHAPCPPEAMQEPEPCGESTNGGCGGFPPAFTPVPWDQTVCGTLWSSTSERDTDWYEFEITEHALITWVVYAPITVQAVLIQPGAGSEGCNDPHVLGWQVGAGPCDILWMDSDCLAPGRYWLWIAAEEFEYLPCEQEYQATLTRVSCGPPSGACCHPGGDCEITTQADCADEWLGPDSTCAECDCLPPPPPGAVPEQEACGTSTNAGCGADPPAFNPIQCGQTVIGTVWATTDDHDTDWYELVVDGPRMFTWTVQADFPARIFVFQAGPEPAPCAQMQLLDTAAGPACSTVQIVTDCLATGRYWFWVATDVWEDLPCPRNYIATLDCLACDLWLGACCREDGTCSLTAAPDCDGVFQGVFTNCAFQPCAVPLCPGDCNCDGLVNFSDIDYFVAAIPDNADSWAILYVDRNGGLPPSCNFLNCDTTGDGHVNFADIDPFVALIPSVCAVAGQP